MDSGGLFSSLKVLGIILVFAVVAIFLSQTSGARRQLPIVQVTPTPTVTTLSEFLDTAADAERISVDLDKTLVEIDKLQTELDDLDKSLSLTEVDAQSIDLEAVR